MHNYIAIYDEGIARSSQATALFRLMQLWINRRRAIVCVAMTEHIPS